jgi:hypothetical protein
MVAGLEGFLIARMQVKIAFVVGNRVLPEM